MKYSFYDDYSEGVHTQILDALLETSKVQTIGYGNDQFSKSAADSIRKHLKEPNAAVYFVSGGTQANLTVLNSMLKPYESVISPENGHIAVHETGAIEATGHKINTIACQDGKIFADGIERVCDEHIDEHMVKPRVVFISQSTELGTIYSKKELEDIAAVCKKHDLYLYLDGARLGSALTCTEADLTLEDISSLVDAFYIGGTKNGALFGEAIVLVNDELKKDFRFYLKQRGALLAKGRAVGIQFHELFKDRLFWDLAEHANKMAVRLTEGLREMKVQFMTEPTTNQLFPIFPDALINHLQKDYGFHVWSKEEEGNSIIRLVTSWATPESAVETFLSDVSATQKL